MLYKTVSWRISDLWFGKKIWMHNFHLEITATLQISEGFFIVSAITFFKLHFRVLETHLTLDFISLQRTQKIKFPEIIKIASHDF